MSRRLTFFLDSGLDPEQYEAQWRNGLVPDRLPYGTEHEPSGWSFEFASRGVPRGLRRIAGVCRRVLGFDLVRAIVNGRQLGGAEAIYCHTEIEYLAVAAVLAFRRRRPVLVGQTIWLFYRFGKLNPTRRVLVRVLLRRVDILISNAAPNLRLGQCIAPRGRHRYIPFGVSRIFGTRGRRRGSPDILSVGNDVARDWPLFSDALATRTHDEIRVASKAPVWVGDREVSRITTSVDELLELYASAGVIVIAVADNAHASGITTLLEAVASGTPAVATRAGGLDDYFSDAEILFVPLGSSAELAAAVERVLTNPAEAARRAETARAAQDAAGYWNDSYWVRVTDAIAEVLEQP